MKYLGSVMNIYFQWREYSVGKDLTVESGADRQIADHNTKERCLELIGAPCLTELFDIIPKLKNETIEAVKHYNGISVDSV